MTSEPENTMHEPQMPHEADGQRSLSPEFLAAVREIENLPGNRDGADKSWVQRALDESNRHFERARRVP